jgi:hypothetical protein
LKNYKKEQVLRAAVHIDFEGARFEQKSANPLGLSAFSSC